LRFDPAPIVAHGGKHEKIRDDEKRQRAQNENRGVPEGKPEGESFVQAIKKS
jgi:hypothetical protein